MKKKKVATNRNGVGFRCVKCDGKTTVYNTKSKVGGFILRVRVCQNCKHVFDTIERLVHQDERARIRAVVTEVLEIERARMPVRK